VPPLTHWQIMEIVHRNAPPLIFEWLQLTIQAFVLPVIQAVKLVFEEDQKDVDHVLVARVFLLLVSSKCKSSTRWHLLIVPQLGTHMETSLLIRLQELMDPVFLNAQIQFDQRYRRILLDLKHLYAIFCLPIVE